MQVRGTLPDVRRTASGATSVDTSVSGEPVPDAASGPSRSDSGAGVSGDRLQRALERNEAGRMRIFSLCIIMVAFGAFVATWLLGGDPVAKGLFLLGSATGGFAAVATYLPLRRGEPYTERMNTMFGLAAVSAVTTGYVYWGIFSAVLLLLPFGAFIFASGTSLRSALVVSLVGYCSHIVISLLVIFGVVPNYGHIQAVDLSVIEQVAVLVVTQAICIAALITARGAHSSTSLAIQEVEKAVRALSLREQLLAEVQDELARALQVGGSGRYTGQALGHYELAEVIGRGAMGEVYEAVDSRDGSMAAVKVLEPDMLSDAKRIRWFLRELHLIEHICSPHVVRVFHAASLDEGLPYLAMERLHGQSLSDQLRGNGRLGQFEVVRLIREAGAGLEAAADVGVVHRDVKPHNIFVTDEGVYKVIDFGVGTLTNGASEMTKGALVGTPSYMAPEQVSGRTVDRMSDLYSLAAVAYRALTGHGVVTHGEMSKVLHAVVHETPRRPSSLGRFHKDVDDVFAIALAKEPAQRFKSAEEFADALDSAIRGQLSEQIRARSEASLSLSVTM